MFYPSRTETRFEQACSVATNKFNHPFRSGFKQAGLLKFGSVRSGVVWVMSQSVTVKLEPGECVGFGGLVVDSRGVRMVLRAQLDGTLRTGFEMGW
jgi:hypothetical protein